MNRYTKKEALIKFVHLDDHLREKVTEDLDKFMAKFSGSGLDAEFLKQVRIQLALLTTKGSGIPDNSLFEVWNKIISEDDANRLLEAHEAIPEDLRVVFQRMMLQAQILAMVEGMKSRPVGGKH